MNMHSVIITPRLRPVRKRFHLMYILGKIPQGLQHHRDAECWGPPGFWHWISYQLLYPAQPTSWGSPLAVITQLTLANLCSCFVHLQKESLRPDTSWSPWCPRFPSLPQPEGQPAPTVHPHVIIFLIDEKRISEPVSLSKGGTQNM